MTTLYRLQMIGIFEAKAPIVHTEESIGNVSRIKRIKILHDGKPVMVPAVSGNSFRGELRDLITDRFVDMIRGDETLKLSPLVYGVLFSGGVLKDKYSSLGEHMTKLMEAVPPLRLLGSAFGDRMMPSKLSVSHLVPLALETRDYLADILENLPTDGHKVRDSLARYEMNLPITEELAFQEGPLTRKNDEDNPVLTRNITLGGDSVEQQQMIYYMECITGGTMLLQRVNTKFPIDDLELGCLLDGLQAFAHTPIIGGRGSAGYGRVEFAYHTTLTPLQQNAEPVVQWLDGDTLRGRMSGRFGEALEIYRTSVKASEEQTRAALACM